jgi:hypothetical protein
MFAASAHVLFPEKTRTKKGGGDVQIDKERTALFGNAGGIQNGQEVIKNDHNNLL